MKLKKKTIKNKFKTKQVAIKKNEDQICQKKIDG